MLCSRGKAGVTTRHPIASTQSSPATSTGDCFCRRLDGGESLEMTLLLLLLLVAVAVDGARINVWSAPEGGAAKSAVGTVSM